MTPLSAIPFFREPKQDGRDSAHRYPLEISNAYMHDHHSLRGGLAPRPASSQRHRWRHTACVLWIAGVHGIDQMLAGALWRHAGYGGHSGQSFPGQQNGYRVRSIVRRGDIWQAVTVKISHGEKRIYSRRWTQRRGEASISVAQ